MTAAAAMAVTAVVVEEKQADNVGDEAGRSDRDDEFRLRDLYEQKEVSMKRHGFAEKTFAGGCDEPV